MVSFFKKGIFLFVVDSSLYYGALSLAIFLRSGNLFDYPYFHELLTHFTILFAFFFLMLFSFRLYEPASIFSIGYFLKYSISSFLLFGVISVLYFYLLASQAASPKILLVYFFILLGTAWYGFRFLHRFFLFVPHFREKIALIGGDEKSSRFIQDVQDAAIPLTVACKLRTLHDDSDEGIDFSGFRECIVRERIAIVVLSNEVFSKQRIMERMASLFPYSLQFLDLCGAYERFLHKIVIHTVDRAWFLRYVSKPADLWHEASKRVVDMTVALLGIVLMAFVFPLIFIAAKIQDGGPVFFLQSRMGQGAKPFTLYKFRTMHRKSRGSDPLWTEVHDLRQTPAGKILRHFHLDEIPQSINILKGDMSFVGPRAERVELTELYEKEIPFYAIRHLVRPGVTGWAQLHFPASASVEEARKKLEYDLFYVKNRSFFLDLQIIFKTVTVVFFKRYVK